MPTPPPFPKSGTLAARLANAVTGFHAFVYRITRGRIGGKIQGVPILLLHHVGRKTAKKRTTPLMYLPDGDNVVLVGSRGGSPSHPAWWLNIRDAGEAVVNVRGERRTVRPRVTAGDERADLWKRSAAVYPDYDVYATRTDREIPVIVLERAAG